MSISEFVAGSPVIQGVKTGISQIAQTPTSIKNFINGTTGSPGLNYVLLPPKGSKGGIMGFIFDYEDEDQVTLEADITDHFAENNSSIQDHIALKPYRIVLKGYVSELVLPATNQGFFGALTTLQQNIGTVPAYLGKYTPQALQKLQGQASRSISQVQNYANTAAQYVNQAKNLATLFGLAGAAPTRQQSAFNTLAQLRDQRIICSVLTPWAYFDGMAIETLVLTQSKETKTKSDISVTMKQMRFVDIKTSPNLNANFAGRAASMYAPKTASGSISGTPLQSPQSFLSTQFSK